MERNAEREGPIAIAVDRDKTSIQALKWSIENHIPQGETLKLIHVIQRSIITSSLNNHCNFKD